MNTVGIFLFYNKNRYSVLLNSCIKPLLNSLEEKKYITSYLLMISTENGPSLRIFLQTSEHRQKFIKFYFNHHIKKWLKKNRSKNENLSNLDTSLWMRYNNNSAHFNNASISINPRLVLNNFDIYSEISQQIYNFININPYFDTEDILTTCILLGIVSLSRYASINMIKSIDSLLDSLCYEIELKEQDAISIESIIEEFDENIVFLRDFNTSLSSSLVNDDFNAIRQWGSMLIDTSAIRQKNTDLDQYIIASLRTVNQCFGLGKGQEIYVFVYLQQLLRKVL